MMFETIRVDCDDRGVTTLTLDRAEKHNALSGAMIGELTEAAGRLGRDPAVRVIVLAGAGESFCAGADLGWMKEQIAADGANRAREATRLATMLSALNTCPKPVIGRVQGNAFGGGLGLMAVCDTVIGVDQARFGFTETRLGLIPATIGPYVVSAIGARQARRYFLTGERFDAAEAYRLGLLHDIVLGGELDARVNEVLGALLVAGPGAQREAKALIRAVADRPVDEDVIADTAERIATVRASDEAREGIAAFLGKRSPAWVPAALRPTKGKR